MLEVDELEVDEDDEHGVHLAGSGFFSAAGKTGSGALGTKQPNRQDYGSESSRILYSVVHALA